MRKETFAAGVVGGLVGGVCIWIYEAVVWVGVQHQMPLGGIPANATGLVFGPATQKALGVWASFIGAGLHFGFAAAWGLLFAATWPFFRKRTVEATLLALGYAPAAWLVMHLAIALVSTHHPNYLDPNVVIGGVMSHLFFTAPMALTVKRLTA